MDGCLWRSTNGGLNFAKQIKSCTLGLGDIVTNATNRNQMYVQGKSAVYSSIDGGRTLAAMTVGRTGVSPGATVANGRLAIGTGPNPPLYATSVNGSAKGLYRWNPTLGWQLMVPNTTDWGQRLFDAALDPADNNRVAVTVLDHPFHDETFAPGVIVTTNGFGGATPYRIENLGLGEWRAQAVAWDPFNAGRLVVGTYGQASSKPISCRDRLRGAPNRRSRPSSDSLWAACVARHGRKNDARSNHRDLSAARLVGAQSHCSEPSAV